MPELPEVEVTIRELRKKILKRVFIDLWTDTKKLIKRPKNFDVFKKEILKKKITKIERRGKNILFFLDNDKVLLIHQKLTGHLLLGKWKRQDNSWIPLKKGHLEDPANRFIHLIFFLDNGLMLALSDLRKFAKVELWDKRQLMQSKEISKLGIDPLSAEFTLKEFKRRITGAKRKIKQVLMDQSVIAGIGNIYSDEALFAAAIHPERRANTLSEKEIKKLYWSIKKILKKAIEVGGESISDYRKPDGSKGGFDALRKVYRREGKPCFVCKTPIKRIKIAQRSSYFCPKCQK